MSIVSHLLTRTTGIRKFGKDLTVASIGMAPASKALALELVQSFHEVLLLHDPFGELLDALFAGTVLANNEWIAPLGLAVDPDVVVVLLEVHYRGRRWGPGEEIVRHTIYLCGNDSLMGTGLSLRPDPVPNVGQRGVCLTLDCVVKKAATDASVFATNCGGPT